MVNLDEVAMMKGIKNQSGSETIDVYLYTKSGERIYFGECENRQFYQDFVDMLYEALVVQFPEEVVSVKDDENRELWS